MKDFFPKIIVSDQVPKNELWLYTPPERVHYLQPGQASHDYRVEMREVGGKMEYFLVCKTNDTVVETKPGQIHKIVNIGGIK